LIRLQTHHMINPDHKAIDEDDLTRCLKDKRWRMNNLYFIKDARGKMVKFQFNHAQSVFFEAMHTKNIILKARQLGFTTFIQVYMLDEAVFNKNTNSGVIAHTKNDAITFFKDKIKYISP